MLDLVALKLDVDKIDNGCWWRVRMEDGSLVGTPVHEPSEDQPEVLLVPVGGGYERQLEREKQPFLEQLRDEAISDAERERLQVLAAGRAAAKKVVRGWRNIKFGGEVVPWSEDAAIKLLTDREWRNFLDFCVVTACNRQAALAREEAQAAKN